MTQVRPRHGDCRVLERVVRIGDRYRRELRALLGVHPGDGLDLLGGHRASAREATIAQALSNERLDQDKEPPSECTGLERHVQLLDVMSERLAEQSRLA